MAFDVATPVYEGPFDLLLHLILKEQVDIYEVRLATIVDAYLQEIEKMQGLDLEVATEFLMIASTLVELKARRLLPGRDDVDLDDELALWEERDLLLARLLECKTFKDVAAVFGRFADDADRSFPRDNFEVSIAYAESADFMRFLLRKSDRIRFASMINRVRDGQSFDRAIAEAYGSDLRRLELEWRTDLEHRFSVIPILTGGGLIWVLVIGLIVAAYVRRRRRSKAILARWEREEAIEDALLAKKREAELAVLQKLREESLAAIPSVAKAATASSAAQIKVEHQGRWHTLH